MKYLFMLLSVMAISLSFTSCSDDDDDASDTDRSELVGRWNKASGAARYSAYFTFNSDGSGTGYINNNSIISVRSYAFEYSMNSKGDVTCRGTYAQADEDGTRTYQTTFKFHLSGSTLTLTDFHDGKFEGVTFRKN